MPGWVKLIAILAALGALVGAVATYTVTVRGWGLAQGRAELATAVAESKTESATAQLEAMQAKSTASAEIAAAQAEASARIVAAERVLGDQLSTVRKVSRETPNFSGVRRPDALVRVRDDQLDAIEAAANRTAELSGRSLQIVPSARP